MITPIVRDTPVFCLMNRTSGGYFAIISSSVSGAGVGVGVGVGVAG